MFLILLVAGSVLAVFGAGAVLFGSGVPVAQPGLGSTLIISGTVAFVGGLILAGIGVAVGELARIADALRTRPAARPSRPAEAAEPVAAARAVPPPPEARIPLPPRPRAAPPPLPEAREARVPEPRMPEPRPPEPRIPEPRVPEPPSAAPRARMPEPPRPVESNVPAVRVPEPRVPRPQTDTTIDVSASAVERLRSFLPRPERKPDLVAEDVPLSPNGGTNGGTNGAPDPHRPADATPTSTRATADEAAPSDAKGPRLDFLFRSKPARSRPSEPAFDVLWPRRPAREGDLQTEGEARAVSPFDLAAAAAETAADEVPLTAAPSAAPESEDRPSSPLALPAPPPQPAAILKSGVVDGMPYTLYADGSIEAQLPEGTVRFGSITELRAHIENGE